MCPNCDRGLTINKEVCLQCAGTGFWNPASLSVNDVQTMQEETATPGDVGVVPEAEVAIPTPDVAPEAAPTEAAAE